MHWFQEIIVSSFSNGKSSRKGWLTKNCTCCVLNGESPDRRHRMGLKYDSNTIGLNCFNCGFHAKWEVGSSLSKAMKQYLTSIGYDDNQIKSFSFKLFTEQPHNSNLAIKPVPVQKVAWNELTLPENALSLNEWMQYGCTDSKLLDVIEYVKSRKLTNYDQLYWSPKGAYATRLLIPFYHNKKLVGYTGRTVAGESPKYLDNRPDNFVYNLNSQKDSRKFVVYTEGLIDAIHVDGICTFGNKLTDYQIDLIKKLKRDIIFVPDYDEAGERLLDKVIDCGWKVSLPDWGFKDVAESVEKTGKIVTLRKILNSVESSRFSIRVKWKMILSNREN